MAEAPPPLLNMAAMGTSDWEEHVTDEGDRYFYNTTTGESNWDPPPDYPGESGDDTLVSNLASEMTRISRYISAASLAAALAAAPSPPAAPADGPGDGNALHEDLAALASSCEPAIRERLRVAAAHATEAERRVCAAIDGRERSLGEEDAGGVQLLLPSAAALFAPDGTVGLEFDVSQGACVVQAVMLKGMCASVDGSSPRLVSRYTLSLPHSSSSI